MPNNRVQLKTSGRVLPDHRKAHPGMHGRPTPGALAISPASVQLDGHTANLILPEVCPCSAGQGGCGVHTEPGPQPLGADTSLAMSDWPGPSRSNLHSSTQGGLNKEGAAKAPVCWLPSACAAVAQMCVGRRSPACAALTRPLVPGCLYLHWRACSKCGQCKTSSCESL